MIRSKPYKRLGFPSFQAKSTSKSVKKRSFYMSSVVKATLCCVLYMLVGPLLILNNKFVLDDLMFPYPVFLSSLGVISTALFSRTVVMLGFVPLEHKSTVNTQFYLKNIFPVGFSLALTLSFGNTVYLYLSVSSIQMLKAFTPVIVLIALVVSKLEKPSRNVVLSVIGIALGTALNCAGANDYSSRGLLIMFLAEAFEAVRLVLTQYLLQNRKFSVVEGQYWIAPASGVCLLFLSALTEGEGLIAELPDMSQYTYYFIASALLGIVVNFASFLVVQTTNSVTLKILGTVRNALFVVFQVIFADEIVTSKQFLAYGLTLVAFGFYNYFKMTEKTNYSKLPTNNNK